MFGISEETDTEACFHGGAFFDAIGHRFERLNRVPDVINADVLDAWFPPAPAVVETFTQHLPWLARTSPPTGSEGMIETIAERRGVPQESIVVGAGSSQLIFLALLHWLRSDSKALILDPSYGEYAHVLEQVIGCRTDRFTLSKDKRFVVDHDELQSTLSEGYDLVVLVNPNNPTGQHIPRDEMIQLIERSPRDTLFWIDEAYIDYLGPDESLERFAAESDNVVVCKSMSKVYALSGLRVGYLVGPPRMMSTLRRRSAPWAVSLPGQLAAVKALDDPTYYDACYRETTALREGLVDELRMLPGLTVISGTANFCLLELAPDAPTTTELMERCRRHNLFLRDPAATSPQLGDRSLRIAVKDAETNARMIGIIQSALAEH